MNTNLSTPYIVQAWAFAAGVRLVIGKSPLMNMENFPYDIWCLHHKLFHRLMKYKKYFVRATKALPQLIQAQVQVKKADEPKPQVQLNPNPEQHVINLLSSSDGEVSEDEDEDVSPEDVEELFEDDETSEEVLS